MWSVAALELFCVGSNYQCEMRIRHTLSAEYSDVRNILRLVCPRVRGEINSQFLLRQTERRRVYLPRWTFGIIVMLALHRTARRTKTLRRCVRSLVHRYPPAASPGAIHCVLFLPWHSGFLVLALH